MIQITCPQCESELQIDPGFAGGICRCFNCGTLMTVPENPAQQEAEMVRQARPDRPDVPGAEAAPAGSLTYLTTSGRQINLTAVDLTRVPTAKKRRLGVRVGVVVVFIALVLAMLVGLIVLIGNVLRTIEQDTPTPGQVIEEQAGRIAAQSLGYDPQANPFLLERPNVLGLPVAHPTVVVIDASAAMSRQFDLLKALIPLNLQTLDPDTPVQVLVAAEEQITALPETLKPAGEVDMASLTERLEAIWPGGGLNLRPAIDRAFAAQPQQMIVIASLVPGEEQLSALPERLAGRQIKCNAVIFGQSSAALEEAAKASGGHYIEMSAGQVGIWYEHYIQRRP